MNDSKKRFYMDLAVHAATMGTCSRAGVGAVIVRDDRVLSLGFNGSARHTPHCKEDGCWIQQRGSTISCVRSVHAEANAICNAAYMGVETRGGEIFCTHYPCVNCLKLIINAGIQKLYYVKPYDDEYSDKLVALARSVLEVEQMTEVLA
jgi:dCMP deaminase